MKKYTVLELLNEFRRNPDITIKGDNIIVKTVDHPNYQGKVGNSTHGKLDFMSKNGYTIVRDNGVKESIDPDKLPVEGPKEKIKIKKQHAED